MIFRLLLVKELFSLETQILKMNLSQKLQIIRIAIMITVLTKVEIKIIMTIMINKVINIVNKLKVWNFKIQD